MSDYARMLMDGWGSVEGSRLEYLSNYIFDFTTYDGEMAELFAAKALEVCAAINSRTTFEYIQDPGNYRWYLLMCNMPFFARRLSWGTSIRGAWWDGAPGQKIEFDTCGLWLGDRQVTETLCFTPEEWREFIAELLKFGEVEISKGQKPPSEP